MIRCRLKELLETRGLSVSKAARMADLAWKTVDAMVKNESQQYDRITIDKLCRALDCTPGELLEYVP